MGLRSVYAKTVRDSRRAALVVGGLAGFFMLATGAPYGIQFATLELRQQFIAGMTSLPLAMRGLLGEPINIETLGGFLSWRVGNTLPVILGLWSVDRLPLSARAQAVLYSTIALASLWLAGSLAASWVIYDLSHLMRGTWILDALGFRPATWINIHAGLDETTPLLRTLFTSRTTG